MKNLISRIFQQKYIGKQWGILALSAGQLAIFVALANLCLNSIEAYDDIFLWMEKRGIALHFGVFMGTIVVSLLVVLLCLFKFALPSFWRVFNEQFYGHGNLLREDVESLKKDNEEIKKGNREILERLEKMERRK